MLLAAVVLALAGCGVVPARTASATWHFPSASASPPAKLAPLDAVVAAATAASRTTYRYTYTNGEYTASLLIDEAAEKATGTVVSTVDEFHLKADLVVIGYTMWLKFEGGPANRVLGIPTQYMRLDMGKLRDRERLAGSSGGRNVIVGGPFLNGLIDVQRADPVHYTGTVDLTKGGMSLVDEDTREKLGDRTSRIPAEFTVDDQGRLVRMVIGLAAVVPVTSITITYGDFGTPVTVGPPPRNDTIEAPARIYDLLNRA